jgi:two-component system sensor histidine kinase KdpD
MFDFSPAGADAKLAERTWLRREFVAREGPDGDAIWLPLVGIHGPLGVLGLRLEDAFDKESEQGHLLADCANQLAISIERVQLANAVRRKELETETERNRNSLLSAISHDLKTPLSAMIAAGSTLLERRAELDEAAADQLLHTIVGEGERLSRLIQNLLSISRLESPTIELRRTPEAIEEIVSVAVDRFTARTSKPEVRVALDGDLPLVSVEPLLVEQVLLNLLENAARYAGPDASVEIRATLSDSVVTVRVSDDGPGIPEDEREKVFEKFYRGRLAGKGDGGVGLGLTICRAIVRAHGGRVVARDRAGGGAVVEFTLPVKASSAVHLGGEEAREGLAS